MRRFQRFEYGLVDHLAVDNDDAIDNKSHNDDSGEENLKIASLNIPSSLRAELQFLPDPCTSED